MLELCGIRRRNLSPSLSLAAERAVNSSTVPPSVLSGPKPLARGHTEEAGVEA